MVLDWVKALVLHMDEAGMADGESLQSRMLGVPGCATES